MEKKICAFCKKVFEGQASRRFCSSSCSASLTNAERARRKVTLKKCATCGEEKEGRNKNCRSCIDQGMPWRITNKTNSEGIKNAGTLRRYLLKTREKICNNCGLSKWLGQNIPLEVDHIDGRADNNKEENLRLLCPNCHAMTPTYKSKNKGNSTRQYRRKRYKNGKTF